MNKHTEQFHGSDLEKIEQLYGICRESIVRFGANVNPLGVSPALKEHLAAHLDIMADYPDREYTALRNVIAEYCRTEPDYIMVGNGSTELISLFIQCHHPKHALLFAPTYSEYEREIRLSGGACSYFLLQPCNGFITELSQLEKELTAEIDLVILCNPNNPTSSFIPPSVMDELLALCESRHISVIVDETYAEFAPDTEPVSAIPLVSRHPNLVVLRGTSKFFAIPGLRLGYAVTGNSSFLSYVLKHQNPWSLNSFADLAGQFLFQDLAYMKQVKNLISQERARICQRLSEIKGLSFFPPAANFILVRIEKEGRDAGGLFDAAIRQNMMIRNCSDFPSLDASYFRFCFMKPQDNALLLDCIEKYMNC